MITEKMVHILSSKKNAVGNRLYLYRGHSENTAKLVWKDAPKGSIMEVFSGTKLVRRRVKQTRLMQETT